MVGSDSPKELETKMLQELKSQNYEKAVEFWLDNSDQTKDKAGPTAEQKEEFVKGVGEKMKATLDKKEGIKEFAITEETISEDGLTAQVKSTVTYGNGKEETRTTKYKKVEGDWKFDNSK